MAQKVLINGVWTTWLSDVMIEMNSKLGSADGRILLSDRDNPGALKFVGTTLGQDMSVVVSDAELSAQQATNATDGAPIIDARTSTVYLYSSGTWTAQPNGTITSYIQVGSYYWNVTTKSMFYAFAIDKLDKIADFGPALATQTQVNAGTADNVAVSAAQAKIAWQLWKTQ